VSPTKRLRHATAASLPECVEQGRMNGDVQVWQRYGPPSSATADLAKWTRAYAQMDENELRLFVDGEACANGEQPFKRVRFAKQQWRIILKEVARSVRNLQML